MWEDEEEIVAEKEKEVEIEIEKELREEATQGPTVLSVRANPHVAAGHRLAGFGDRQEPHGALRGYRGGVHVGLRGGREARARRGR